MSRWLRIAIVIVLQTAALAVMIGMKQYTLNTGTPIVLKTQPLDPRSLFSGDYVRLNYEISQLPVEQLAGDKDFDRGDAVYVALEQHGEFWEPVSLHRAYPEAAAGQVVIKGKVEYLNQMRFRQPGQPPDKTKTLHVKYGVENYYVPEGEGHDLERPKPGEVVSIRVVVDKSGNAGIKAVLVNGQERYVERLL
jgi:uncharacterized membrane-anchored protein